MLRQLLRRRAADADTSADDATRRVADATRDLERAFRRIEPALNQLPGIVAPRKDTPGDRNPRPCRHRHGAA